MQHRFRGVTDPDQAWLLGELIAYLDHEKSGAGGFQDMGQSWPRVRDGARQGTLRVADREVRAVAERWEQFIDYLALGLSQDLGRDVEALRPRKQSLPERVDALVQELVGAGTLTGGVRVPDAIAAVSIVADLRARQLVTSVRLDAPREGRPSARINWILRQLSKAPPDLRITVSFASTRETTSLLLSEAREYPQRLLSPTSPKREPRAFELAMNRALGTKSGKGQGSFVRETRQQVVDFYGELVQDLKHWQARAPQLPDAPVEVPVTPQADAPPFIAPERDIGEARTPRRSRQSSANPGSPGSTVCKRPALPRTRHQRSRSSAVDAAAPVATRDSGQSRCCELHRCECALAPLLDQTAKKPQGSGVELRIISSRIDADEPQSVRQ